MLSSEDRCLLAYRYVMIRDDTRGIIKMLEFVFLRQFWKISDRYGRFWKILGNSGAGGTQGISGEKTCLNEAQLIPHEATAHHCAVN